MDNFICVGGRYLLDTGRVTLLYLLNLITLLFFVVGSETYAPYLYARQALAFLLIIVATMQVGMKGVVLLLHYIHSIKKNNRVRISTFRRRRSVGTYR